MIRRWAFNLAGAVSLLVCLASTGLWLWSYHGSRGVERDAQGVRSYRDTMVNISRGKIVVDDEIMQHDVDATELKQVEWNSRQGVRLDRPIGNYPTKYEFDPGALLSSSSFEVCGFGWHYLSTYDQGIFEHKFFVVMPVGAISIPAAVITMFWIRRLLKQRAKLRRMASEAACRTCGYGLTANTSGVCPECGTPVPTNPEAVA